MLRHHVNLRRSTYNAKIMAAANVRAKFEELFLTEIIIFIICCHFAVRLTARVVYILIKIFLSQLCKVVRRRARTIKIAIVLAGID